MSWLVLVEPLGTLQRTGTYKHLRPWHLVILRYEYQHTSSAFCLLSTSHWALPEQQAADLKRRHLLLKVSQKDLIAKTFCSRFHFGIIDQKTPVRIFRFLGFLKTGCYFGQSKLKSKYLGPVKSPVCGSYWNSLFTYVSVWLQSVNKFL